jgi:hypothetical protein
METLLAIINIVFILLFCWWQWRRQELPHRKFYWHGVAAKLSAGLLLGIIYGVVYTTSDTLIMFESAKELSALARTDVGGYISYLWSGGGEGYFLGTDRTLFFVKIVSMIAWLTYDNYWITSLYFSLISFFAAWHLSKLIWAKSPELGLPAVVAFLFFPSCVFWTSGIIKESLAVAGLYVVALVFLKIWWRQKVSIVSIILTLIAIWITWNLKYYYIGLLLPILFAAWLARKISEFRKMESYGKQFLILSLLLVSMLALASLVHPNFSVNKIVEVLVVNNQTSLLASNPHDVIQYYNLHESWGSVIINTPWALVSGLTRPFVWEADSLLQVLVAMENSVIVLLILFSVRSFFRLKDSPDRLLVLALLLYSVVLCIFLALSTPNFGTLVRYRIGFLPVIMFLLLNQPAIVRMLAKVFNVRLDRLSH